MTHTKVAVVLVLSGSFLYLFCCNAQEMFGLQLLNTAWIQTTETTVNSEADINEI